MSDKLECPGCNSYTSSVAYAVDYEQPCPHCGLPAATILEVQAIRSSLADGDLKERLEQATIEAMRLRVENLKLRDKMVAIRHLVRENDDDA